jgi:hypothetical protein
MTDVLIGTRIDLRQALTLLDAERLKAADLSPVFQGPIDSLITRFFERQFDTRGSAGGTPWQNIAPLTQKLRRRPGHGHEGPTAVLRDTNVLWSSYVKSGGPDSIRVIEPQFYARGSAVPYAAAHQEQRTLRMLFGRPLREPKTVPARPVVPSELPQDVITGIETAVTQHLESTNGSA